MCFHRWVEQTVSSDSPCARVPHCRLAVRSTTQRHLPSARCFALTVGLSWYGQPCPAPQNCPRQILWLQHHTSSTQRFITCLAEVSCSPAPTHRPPWTTYVNLGDSSAVNPVPLTDLVYNTGTSLSTLLIGVYLRQE